jgi:DNA polymerase III subunit alpha
MPSSFIHLNLHSEYSMVDGIVRIKPLMKALSEQSIPAVAVTDKTNLFAAVKVYTAAIDVGIKPIIGCDIDIENDEDSKSAYRLVLLCQNQIGYKNLTALVSKAYTDGQNLGVPQVKKEWVEDYSEGIIALSGAMLGDVGQAIANNDLQKAKDNLAYWSKVFPDRFYLELQRIGFNDEEHYIQKACELALAQDIPVVATNAVCFIDKADFEAHEARVCIHDGYILADTRRPHRYTEQQYLRTPAEMQALFSDIPESLENTVQIAKRCNVKLNLGKNYLPIFPIPDGMTVEQYLSHTSKQGLEERLKILFKDKITQLNQLREPYDERLQIELDVINSMGFPGYFLIVADFIQWAKDNGVPVGPGRGSGAGSLVAYALNITDLDPLEYELLFERFLNPERVSMPDFDIDFCMEGRDKVIDYVAEKYGRTSVSQIITFGTMAAKAVIRDVGRVLGHPYGFVDRIAKLIPFEIGMTLTKALEQGDELKEAYEQDDDVKDLIELAMKLEGVTRNAGKHAGGVVIAPSELTDFTAIYCEQDSKQIVSQFDKDDVEAAGLVKFDFLGLRTLTIIDWALQTINGQLKANGENEVDITLIETDDKKTFELLKACQTTAVFQLESRGMKDLIKRLQPDCFEDIIALVALFRPGPLQSGMVDDFIDRKHGRAKVEYPHPDLEPILKPTYGVILYQEQVMQIAQVLANFTLGAADLLRRAMGKKKLEEMAKQRSIFTEGAIARGVDEGVATYIFDLMEKFAGYGFNKSHSAAYALVAYQTAWLKAHHPAAFMAAVMSSDMDNTDKVVTFIEEAKKMQILVIPPSINQSNNKFSVKQDDAIVYGLGAIKGVGESAIEHIMTSRSRHGQFTDLFTFCQALDCRKVNRRVLEALIRCGAMDLWQVPRASLYASIDKALKLAEQNVRNQSAGQHDLFSAVEQKSATDEYVHVKDWDEMARLKGEKETLGLYLTGHPVFQFRKEFEHYTKTTLAKLTPMAKKNVIVYGLVLSVRKIITKRGKKMAIVTIDDATSRLDIAFFSEIYQQKHELLQKDEIIVVEGEVSHDDFSGGIKMIANQLFSIDEARQHFVKHLRLSLNHHQGELLEKIAPILRSFPGMTPVMIEYKNANASAKIALGKKWQVNPCHEIIEQLSIHLTVELIY